MDDFRLLQGVWKLESITGSSGNAIGFDGILGCRVVRDEMNEWLDDAATEAVGNTEVNSRFKIMPNSEPKRIVLVTKWRDNGRACSSHVQKGFYEISERTLKIIWGPDRFPSKDPEGYRQTSVYRRQE